MKKLIYCTAALAAMIFAGSCQQENLEPVAQGNTVTYTVELPGLATKAGATDYKFGSGLNTDELIYEVWKTENSNETNLTGTNAVRLYQETVDLYVIDGVRKTTISLNLVQDQEYTILFWAQVKGADVYNTENLTKVQYKKDPAKANYDANREDMAAFYAVDFVSDGDPKSKTVYLKRPFAQLNIATEITTEEYKITLDKAEVVVDNVPAAFNVATKTSYAEERTRFVFKNADVPQEPNKTIEVNDHTYNYVAMNYMFATNGGQTATVKYSIDATLTSRNLDGKIEGETTKATVTNAVQNVPLQENYRTNIVGNLITSTTDYEVVIDARWDDVNDPDLNGDGYLVEVWDKKYTQEPPMVDGAYQISLASELAWVAAVANGNIVATKSTTVDPTFKNITVKLIEDIDLAGALWNPIKDFDGTFDGNGKTIKNLTVKAEGMDRAALFAHAHRVKDLTVTNADIKGHYKTAVIVADAMGGGIVIENCAVVNSTVEATPINKDEANNVGAIVGYLSAENDACVKNCVVKDVTIKAFRKVGTIAGVANCAAVVKDNVMDNVTIIADQTVEYVKNDYDGNAGPVVGWAAAEATVTGNTVGDNVVVKRYVDTTEELAYAVEDAQNGDTIYIKGDVTMASFKNKSLTFVGLEGKGRVIMPKTHVNNKDFEGSSLYFENLKLYGPNYGGDTTTHGYVGAVAETYKSCTFENYYTFYSNVTNVTDCVFKGFESQYFWTGQSNKITFTNCQFNGVDRAVNVCGNVATGEPNVVTFENCEFSATKENKAALEISGDHGPYTINVNNCKVTGFKAGATTGEDLFNIKNTPENVTVYIDGNKWVGTGTVETEQGTKIYITTAGLLAAIEAAKDGDVLLLGDAKFDGIFHVGNKSITLKPADNCKPEVAGRVSFAGSPSTTLTLENLKLSVSENTGKAIGNQYYDKYALYILGNYCGNVVVKNCVFTGMTDTFGAIHYYAHTGGTTTENLEKLTVENCTFDGGRAIRSRANVSVTGSTFKGLVENNPCLQIVGFGADQLASNVVFTGNTSAASASGVCLKTSEHSIKNVTFNVGGNTNCNYITFDSKNLNNLYPETYTYTDEVDTIIPEDSKGLNFLMTKNVPEIKLLPGEYEMTSYKAGVKLIGTKAEEVKVNVAGKMFGLQGGDVHIENVTLIFANANYCGFQHTGNETYKNCVIEGQPFLYGNNVTFNKCTFKQTSSDWYNVWTYGAKNVNFNECEFNSAGKSVLVYNESGPGTAVTFNNSTLTASVPVDGKAAIEIDSSLLPDDQKHVININNTVADGFAAGSISKSTLWNIKKGAEKAEVYVNDTRMIADGVVLNAAGEYELNAVNGLFWFADQVNVAKNDFSGKTVKLAAAIDLKNAAWTPVGQTGATTFNGVFDGQNYTISNLNVNSEDQKGAHYSSGLFGWVESHTDGHGHIKNVKIEGATITGHHNCGALVGYITQETALVENCHVTYATINCTKANADADGDKAGALIGNATVATPVKKCTAASSTVSAGRDAGQVIGAGKEANVTECSATEVAVSANGTSTGANVRNEVIGRLLN